MVFSTQCSVVPWDTGDVNCFCFFCIPRYEMLDPFHVWMQEKATKVENQSLCIPVTTWAATRYCINNCVSQLCVCL